MMELVNLINQYSGLLSVMVAFITAIITLIYVIFTYKQMKASQDSLKLAIKQFKVDKQPCIVYKTIKSEGTHCFYKQCCSIMDILFYNLPIVAKIEGNICPDPSKYKFEDRKYWRCSGYVYLCVFIFATSK